ncbi:hypothetical protein SPRG_08438 [Saprolegnia parasitica CBS 223.65]|uniref:FYVE-type domain-containing protein n=1 Tax=Saprolegnia parasitica (strain CBS 223.65) TaxID=695850 RepID=A0A067CGY6_SAPPC|nr:hypothetical protein SPRG_08438 [Saprolegnia parasitica CBS 223.65]KDO26077.1 hypothetical protein SPRG_08438 [Saprolegnia parasitica CBS 223.65]|eukprot:XP_012203073.1 hypothetical protein SPRG_08438 [Saprolegnia parasitica CBS 223.65]
MASLPLPRGYFNMSNMTEAERLQYAEYAESAIRKVFALSDFHKNSWVPVHEKKGVAVYRNFTAKPRLAPNVSKSNIAEVGCKSSLQASLDDIARAFAAHDDGLFRRLMKKLNPRVVDAAVLQSIVPRTASNPYRYVGIKWYATKSASMMVTNRDYCVLEVLDRIVDARGNDMLVRVLSSIDLPECPSLEASHGFVRGKLLAGFIYQMDAAEAKMARMHHVVRFDPNGYCPSNLAYKIAEQDVVTSMVQLKRIVDKLQMTTCTLLDKSQWIPAATRSSCNLCGRGFGFFRHRHHCRACGEVICSKCSLHRSADVPGTTIKKIRICSICNIGVTTNENEHSDHLTELSLLSANSSATQAYNEMNMYDLYNANGPSTPSAYSTASAGSTFSNTSYRSATTEYNRHYSQPVPPTNMMPAPLPRAASWSRPRAKDPSPLSSRRGLAPVDLSYLPKTPTTATSSAAASPSQSQQLFPSTPQQSTSQTPTFGTKLARKESSKDVKLDLSYLPQTPKTPRSGFATTPKHATVAKTVARPPTKTPFFGESLQFPPNAASVANPPAASEAARSLEDALRKSYSGVAVDYVYSMLAEKAASHNPPPALVPSS